MDSINGFDTPNHAAGCNTASRAQIFEDMQPHVGMHEHVLGHRTLIALWIHGRSIADTRIDVGWTCAGVCCQGSRSLTALRCFTTSRLQ